MAAACTPGTKELLRTLHFPACSGAGHACDVTMSIYTATGKNSFLHCYIVTTGAGAKRLRKGVFSLERLQRFDTSRGGGKEIKANQSAFNARRRRSERSPTEPAPVRKGIKHSTDVSGFLHRKHFKAYIGKIRHSGCSRYSCCTEKKKCRGTNRS